MIISPALREKLYNRADELFEQGAELHREISFERYLNEPDSDYLTNSQIELDRLWERRQRIYRFLFEETVE